MLFNSLVFGVFAAIVLPVWFVLPNRPRRYWLTAASLFFYGWWDVRFLALLLATSTIDWFAALRITDDPARKRPWLLLSVVSNLVVLGGFKYLGFFVHEAAAALAAIGLPHDIPTLSIVLPVGLSFYTFQAMAYTIDVYRGHTPACRSWPEFVLFISFFPQLVAGPIERSDRLLPQLAVSPNPTAAQLADGALLIVWGFFKKLVVADNLVTIVGRAFDMPDASSLGTLLGMYAFTWQIYCDFSGYSDIARGFAKWLGVELMVNFNLPFFADSPRDIWRRWHISLSEWLRDYLYIPMGGGRSHAGRNLILTMLLGGLWHGANWTFIAWGAWHGVALALQRRVRWSLPRPLAIVLTFHLLMFGFVLFRAPSIGSFVAMMGRLGEYTFQRGDLPWLRLLVWLTLPVFAAELWTFLGRPVPRPLRAALVVVATVAIVLLGASQGQPFVYFQF